MSSLGSTNITYHPGNITREERHQTLKQKGGTIWFTGLSACGKSTVAVALEQVLFQRGHAAYVLDGDNIRFGLNAGPKILMDTRQYSETTAKRFGLGFSAEDRTENIRRIGEVAKLFADAGIITVTSFISPYRADRDMVRKLHEEAKLPFVECFVDTPIEICEQRDPKGLYKKARAGELKGFTGIDDPYEAPLKPELVLKGGEKDVPALVGEVLDYLQKTGFFTV